METALVIGAAAIGLYALWRVTQQQSAGAPAPAPQPSPAPAANLTQLVTQAILHPNSVNHALFGVGTDSFPTFDEQGAFQRLLTNANSCYRSGNNAACIAVKQQAPGMLNCTPRGNNGGHVDCDVNMKDLGNGQVQYHTSDGLSHTTKFGNKVPVGGCSPWPKLSDGYDNTKDAAANVAGGYCSAGAA